MDPGPADTLAGWYSNPNSSSSSNEMLFTAFSHAKLLLRSTIKPQDYEKLFPSTTTDLSPHHTISDVQWSLEQARIKYEGKSGACTDVFAQIAPTTAIPSLGQDTKLSKARAKAGMWLRSLSEKVLYYGNIFDVLAQHHPEYVSLAWGTFKLVFVAIANHAETASKLSKSICQIADLLPQQSLLLILYPTPQMQTFTARLFGHILTFFISAIHWYEDGRFMHAAKSILQPWALKFRPQYEVIEAEARRIKALADLAMKTEVRHTRLEVIQGAKNLDLMKKDLNDLFNTKFEAIHHMCKQIHLDLRGQRTTLNRVHLTQMQTLPLWNAFPTPGDSLRFCRSISSRRPGRIKLPLPDVTKLNTWASQRNNTLLLIDTYVPWVSKAFMVELIDLITDTGVPIIWALRYENYLDQRISSIDILRMLVQKAIQVGSGHFLDDPFPVTVEQLQEAASLRDWVAILGRLLPAISPAFVVLDADLMAHATNQDRSEALEIIDVIRSQVSANVKIVTALSSVSRVYAEDLEQLGLCVRIQTGSARDWRNTRRQRRPFSRLKDSNYRGYA